MNDENAILKYYQGITDGSITVGKWVRMLYDTIIDGLESKRWFFNQRRANAAIGFIEKYCHHYKGALAPDRIKLSLWQKAALSLMFGIVDADGIRQFTECMFVVGRKCGKTLIAAGIETFFAYAAGEFGSEIYFLAPKLAQADLAFSALEFNVNHEPTLQKKTKSTRTRGLYIKESNTTVQKLPFADKKSDGYGPMSWVGDEASSWIGDRGLKQWEVMVSGTGARVEPFGIAISSAGYENDGIYDELFRRGTAFLMGNSKEEHFLPILYTIDDVDKWDDINELRKSLPGLGESVSVKFILKEIDTARESLSKKVEFLTKYCNIKQNSSQAWLTAQDVKKCFGNEKTFEDFRHTYALGGIDLSLAVDLTAAVIVIERDGVSWFATQFFMPANKVDEATQRDGLPYRIYAERGLLTISGENTVDYHDVHAWFNRLEREYEILPLKVGYDRYSAAYLVQDMEADGFSMESVSQGSNLTGVLIDMEGMIKDGRLRCINDNDLMKVHMLDAALKFEEGTNRRRLIKMSAKQHIDGMAALSDAICMRHNYYEEMQAQLSNQR
jgi:phage terminase large subunit-like protein